MKKLSIKIFISIFALAFFTVFILTFFLLFSSEKVVKKYAGEYQVSIAREIMTSISNETGKGRALAELIAGSNTVANFFAKKTKAEQAQEELINLRGVLLSVEEIDILGLDGEELLSTKGEGVMLESDRKKIRSANSGSYYEHIKKYGKTVNSDIITNKESGSSFIIFTAPVKNEIGEIVGFVETESSSGSIREQLSHLTKDFDVFLINNSGTVISTGDNLEMVGKNLSNSEIIKLALVEKGAYAKLPSLVTNEDSFYGVARERSSAQGVGSIWAVIVEKNYNDLYGPIKNSIFTLIFAMVILILGCAAGAVFFVQVGVSDPIQKIINAIKNVSKGRKYEPALENLNNEIGQLDIAFRATFNELDTLKNSLEDKIKEKAEELKLVIKNTENQNKELEQTKRAMINILEDVKESEESIKKAKENVEEEVKERTRELREEQARLTTSINSLPVGFLLLDENEKIIVKNHAVSHILGIPESETTLENIKKYFEGAADLGALQEQCLKEKRPIEIKDINVGNKFLHLMMALVFMANDSEGAIGRIFMIEDVTEEKVVDRSREEFFAVASHELRTPLTAIRGNTSLIQEFYADKIKDKEVMGMIEDMHGASVRLISIVNDFLDASSLEQGKMKFKKEPVDIFALIQEVARDFKTVVSSKGLSLNLEKAKSALPLAVVDKDKAKQVLFNFISNGLNYTQKGEVTVKVEKQSKFLKVYVTDTGVGISATNQSLLFRKFQQAGEKVLTREMSKSTGLGLYISKLLIEGMGGTVELIKSEPGVGSTFAFTLPIA